MDTVLCNHSVLVVDDQAGVRRLLQEALRDDNMEVFLAAGGEEAIKIVRERYPDIILMDLKMPGQNGLELLEEIHNMGFNGPVILMTAYGELEMVTQARKLGISHYLTKPFDIYEVKSLLHNIAAEINKTGCVAGK